MPTGISGAMPMGVDMAVEDPICAIFAQRCGVLTHVANAADAI